MLKFTSLSGKPRFRYNNNNYNNYTLTFPITHQPQASWSSSWSIWIEI